MAAAGARIEVAPGLRLEAERRPYMPRGAAAEALYDRSNWLCLHGPAGTGKSRMALEKCLLLGSLFPGIRVLFLRLTRESMSESLLYTWEEHVLPQGSAMLSPTVKRNYRQKYVDPSTGSEYVVCGLDDPQKVLSTEFDVAYCNEAIEVPRESLELVGTRLRNGRMPYQQLVFDCNPGPPAHWIKRGGDRGDFPFYATYHEDNPVLWQEAPPGAETGPGTGWPETAPDGRRGRWTARGLQYLAQLDLLTGARKQRLRYGRWVGAEGAVYEGWDSDLHVVDDDRVPASAWAGGRAWTVDFGFTHPFCWIEWAKDADGRWWALNEVYMTRRLVSDHCRRILQITGWERGGDGALRRARPDASPLPQVVLCDWDAEGRATFEAETGIKTTPAYKSIREGVNAAAELLKRRPGPGGEPGLPGVLWRRGLLDEADHELDSRHRPTRSYQEPDGYVWDKAAARAADGDLKEVPVDRDNHGMDGFRYLAAWDAGLVDKLSAKDVASSVDLRGTVVAVPRRAERRGASLGEAHSIWGRTRGARRRRAR